ncbi:MAG: nucleotidyltransferase domain-containing protein [Chloroflexi bacterium]|nr:nucleotidyltransferase domain-containing protein [Chloroflexota bacterium]
MNKNIIRTQIQANQQFSSGLGVEKLILFGSVARGEATQISDIDFLVHFQKPSSFDQYMNLKIYLAVK